jgi:ABC-2 type transport system ATP-binding protein
MNAVRGVSLEVHEGEIFGLLGPNGAGKTTVLECIVGLRVPDEGDIEVAGIDATRRTRDMQQRIGVMLQATALQDKITPREALQLFGSFYRHASDPGSLLERFSLTDKADTTFDTLSGGQRQRLALALAFVNTPEILFLDEPTAGLDPQSRRELREEIARLKHDGRTVLLTTHDVDEAERLCDRVAIMDRGRIIAVGTPLELSAESASMQSVAFRTNTPIDAGRLSRVDGIADLVCDGTSTTFRTADMRPTLRALAEFLQHEGIDLIDLHVRRATLEDVFLRLIHAGVEKN